MIVETKQKRWYTIKVQNNRERSVSERLLSDMKREFDEEVNFLIPTQGVVGLRNGKKILKEKILYPGYLFVETSSIDKVSHLVKTTNGATNVLKDSKGNPQPLSESEVVRMIGEKEKVSKTLIETNFVVGEKVEIMNGPFTKFKGEIESLDPEKNKVRVQVMIFGRGTGVDLTFDDITKLEE